MENKLPTPPKHTYQRKTAVTIAPERADITIAGFPYRIWLETGKIHFPQGSYVENPQIYVRNGGK